MKISRWVLTMLVVVIGGLLSSCADRSWPLTKRAAIDASKLTPESTAALAQIKPGMTRAQLDALFTRDDGTLSPDVEIFYRQNTPRLLSESS